MVMVAGKTYINFRKINLKTIDHSNMIGIEQQNHSLYIK